MRSLPALLAAFVLSALPALAELVTRCSKRFAQGTIRVEMRFLHLLHYGGYGKVQVLFILFP